MKRLCVIAFFSVLIVSVCCSTDTFGLMRIIEDPSAYGVTMSFAEKDDADDTTPPFSASNYNITINNHSRRYVGICIDQVYNGTTNIVDNGQDDRFMGPATEIFSYKTVVDFIDDIINWTAPEPPPATGTYALPMPDELPYGSEIKFPIRVVGPAWMKRFPLPLDDPLRCYGEDVTGTTIVTDIHMLLLPLFSQLTGATTNNDLIQIIMNDFLINFATLHIEVTNAMADGEVYVVMENVVKYVVGSEQMQKFFENDSNQILGKIKDILLTPAALAEALNVFLHLASDQWLYRFEVRIVRPKIDYLQPDMGLPRSTVAITGVGFDPEFGTEPKNNRVFFRNASGGEVEATEVKTFDEKLLKVTVPEGAATGPLKVCTGSPPSMGTVSTLCSNEDVIFTVGLEPKLSIISPVDGATVSGAVDISLELKNPPNPFPTSEAQLFVDSQPSGRMAVSSPTFIFAFDTSGLAAGEHSIEVWLNLGGEIYTSLPLLLFVEAEEPSGPRLIISSPSPDQHFYKNQHITLTAEILNGPVPANSSETLDYTFSVNGNAWSYKSLKPFTSYPGCYNVTFSLADLELQDENVFSVRAVGKNGTAPLYDLTASVRILVENAPMEYPNPMEISGCIDSKSPIILLFPWPDHSEVIDHAFSFGTCGPDSAGKYGNYIVEVGFQEKMTSPTFGTYYNTRNSFSHQALSNKPFRFYTAGPASNPTIFIKSSIYDLPSDSCRLPTNQSECKIYNYTKEWCDGFDCWPAVSIIDYPCTNDPYYPDTTDRFKITIYSSGKHPCAYYVSER
jgi:hypothetical protein